MVIEIEYYKGDTLLYGHTVTKRELLNQLNQIESVYDPISDNFTELLCIRFSYDRIDKSDHPDYTYDRDTGILY